MQMIFTFWEGKMPDYIRMCLETWKLPYTMLNYDNLREYTDYDIEGAKRFTLPQIADAVRVHVLRDHGGYWLDADTIMIGDELPEETIMGNPIIRLNTIGFLHAEKPHENMFEEWAAYQDKVIADLSYDCRWDVLGNRYTDCYLFEHREVPIANVSNRWAETYMIPDCTRLYAYHEFYFNDKYHLSDLRETDMLMLHNSWTPDWYKKLTREQVLESNCTMSNVLREVLENVVDADKA